MTTDLELSPYVFQTRYMANGTYSPVYNVQQPPAGSRAFNTEDTPFIIPSDVQSWGVMVQADLMNTSSAPVYWRLSIQFFAGGNKLIVSQGINENNPAFNTADVDYLPILNPGAGLNVGSTPISDVGTSAWHQFQPSDLPADVPVEARITATPFATPSAGNATPLSDSNPVDNELVFWVMRAP